MGLSINGEYHKGPYTNTNTYIYIYNDFDFEVRPCISFPHFGNLGELPHDPRTRYADLPHDAEALPVAAIRLAEVVGE